MEFCLQLHVDHRMKFFEIIELCLSFKRLSVSKSFSCSFVINQFSLNICKRRKTEFLTFPLHVYLQRQYM